MAPYRMKVEVINDTDDEIRWIGASTLRGLDGNTSVDRLGIGPKSIGTTEIVKSGGTDGLFTTLSWEVPRKVQFSVYSAMPASAGFDIFVGLRDITHMSWDQFKDSTVTDNNYNLYTRPEYQNNSTIWRDEIKREDLRVSMRAVNLDFPNSHYCVYVVSKKYSDQENERVAELIRNGCKTM